MGPFLPEEHIVKILPTQFDGHAIRRLYDEATDTWWFSVIDVVQILTESENARDYWFKMKQRVKAEDGAELSTFCRQLKLPAADGKQRLTDCATAESLLRLVQSIPSPKAEPIKLWSDRRTAGRHRPAREQGRGPCRRAHRPPGAPAARSPDGAIGDHGCQFPAATGRREGRARATAAQGETSPHATQKIMISPANRPRYLRPSTSLVAASSRPVSARRLSRWKVRMAAAVLGPILPSGVPTS